uniref:Uncharacterized protein n=1 Tax=Candidatus Kentrum sp. MB TaxID=2138164 RepID=A0A450XUC5_9GAMM|nr:MAG: hypothetical protein BECKMB1821G_GA0114241_103721 [Candidatus Kentron sp. MB]VFK32868.1 MAG: hypothetical protein BECKMB1821I_GA0114274_103719 [Candidatus Kentron sp. MB]VFK75929.1 MAG: hypothetical protein BECKMB1821H_GA0114242_10368 [Candidatus Kentron sp. MB]
MNNNLQFFPPRAGPAGFLLEEYRFWIALLLLISLLTHSCEESVQ